MEDSQRLLSDRLGGPDGMTNLAILVVFFSILMILSFWCVRSYFIIRKLRIDRDLLRAQATLPGFHEKPKQQPVPSVNAAISTAAFFGMWTDHTDLEDSSDWVRKVRRNEW